MRFPEIIEESLSGKSLDFNQLITLYRYEDLPALMFAGHQIRKKMHPHNNVGWMIDRNVNITNVCTSGCLFCNFHCSKNSKRAYVTSIEEYKKKIEELYKLGGNQLLIQGGMHPELGLEFYEELFSDLKHFYPDIKLHALGPPEIVYLSQKSKLDYTLVLKRLIAAGLDSLPGAGAEILDNAIRKKISPNKCSADEWLEVMRIAHLLNLTTSATMMFGHIEDFEHRIEHLLKIRHLQAIKPPSSKGFLSFIPWPVQYEGTALLKKYRNLSIISATDYLRLIAISRIALNNIPNIQSSLLTIGKDVAQVSLYCGANDLGSIMIEENVVSSAGSGYRIGVNEMKKNIFEAGFLPKQRNQDFF
jgi:cyclic dehypoxanthinyl futalosine synthase